MPRGFIATNNCLVSAGGKKLHQGRAEPLSSFSINRLFTFYLDVLAHLRIACGLPCIIVNEIPTAFAHFVIFDYRFLDFLHLRGELFDEFFFLGLAALRVGKSRDCCRRADVGYGELHAGRLKAFARIFRDKGISGEFVTRRKDTLGIMFQAFGQIEVANLGALVYVLQDVGILRHYYLGFAVSLPPFIV